MHIEYLLDVRLMRGGLAKMNQMDQPCEGVLWLGCCTLYIYCVAVGIGSGVQKYFRSLVEWTQPS